MLVYDVVNVLLTRVMLSACVGNMICLMIFMMAMTESLNQSYIRLTAEKLSHHLVAFADTVLHPQTLRDIYTSVDYDMFQINGYQVVIELSNALGKLTVSFRTI